MILANKNTKTKTETNWFEFVFRFPLFGHSGLKMVCLEFFIHERLVERASYLNQY